MSDIVNIKTGIENPAGVIDALSEDKFTYASIMVIYTTKDGHIDGMASGEDLLKMLGALEAAKMYLWELTGK